MRLAKFTAVNSLIFEASRDLTNYFNITSSWWLPNDVELWFDVDLTLIYSEIVNPYMYL